MKRLFINITNVSPSKPLLFALLFFFLSPVFSFQTDFPELDKDPLALVESGRATLKNVPKAYYYLAEGDYEAALAAVDERSTPNAVWLRAYLETLLKARKGLVMNESDNFRLFTVPDQQFLKAYVLPALEEVRRHLKRVFNHAPNKKINVEIYPTKETFSVASTLSLKILKRSGAIGICKFHRLMIMSPKSLPLGYRWLDALSHEYLHLMINEMTAAKAELWLHEGTARYFETSYRSDPPNFLSPNQKTKLKEAVEEDRLIAFKRMSPSLVYLKDQDEVSLAFAQVSHGISVLVEEEGEKKFKGFLKSLQKKPFRPAFEKAYGLSVQQFEERLKNRLAEEKWDKTVGAMPDEITFGSFNEDSVIGANVKGKIRLGDRMRMRNRPEAALIEYEKALEEEPDNAIILLKAARTQYQLGDKEEAVVKLRRAVEKNPNYGTPHIDLAKLVGPKEGIPLLLTANAINPFNPEIHQLLALYYKQVGDHPKAQLEESIAKQLLKR